MRDGISGNQRRIIKNQGASSIGRLGGSVDSGQHVWRASAARLSSGNHKIKNRVCIGSRVDNAGFRSRISGCHRAYIDSSGGSGRSSSAFSACLAGGACRSGFTRRASGASSSCRACSPGGAGRPFRSNGTSRTCSTGCTCSTSGAGCSRSASSTRRSGRTSGNHKIQNMVRSAAYVCNRSWRAGLCGSSVSNGESGGLPIITSWTSWTSWSSCAGRAGRSCGSGRTSGTGCA